MKISRILIAFVLLTTFSCSSAKPGTIDDGQHTEKPTQITPSELDGEYEKIEEETYWINSYQVVANKAFGIASMCLQFQKGDTLAKDGKWDVLCDQIEKFDYVEGNYYQIRILKKWLIDHESLLDRSPYDLELLTVISKEKDPQASSIKVNIATDKSVYNIGERIELAMEVKNTGGKPYTFLPWGTPIEEYFTSDCLEVIYNKNEKINYSGPLAKRTPPTEKDYITLNPGKTANGKLNLLKGYKLTKKGTYTIKFNKLFRLPESNSITIELK